MEERKHQHNYKDLNKRFRRLCDEAEKTYFSQESAFVEQDWSLDHKCSWKDTRCQWKKEIWFQQHQRIEEQKRTNSLWWTSHPQSLQRIHPRNQLWPKQKNQSNMLHGRTDWNSILESELDFDLKKTFEQAKQPARTVFQPNLFSYVIPGPRVAVEVAERNILIRERTRNVEANCFHHTSWEAFSGRLWRILHR